MSRQPDNVNEDTISSDETSQEDLSIQEELDEVVEPITKRLFIMSLKTGRAVVLGIAIACTYPVIGLAQDPTTRHTPVTQVEEEPSSVEDTPLNKSWNWIKNTTSSITSKGKAAYDGKFNNDEKLRRAALREQELLDRISELETDLARNTITVKANHQFMIECSSEVANYLKALEVNTNER